MRKKQTDCSDGNQNLNQPPDQQLYPQQPPIEAIDFSEFRTPQQQSMVYIRSTYSNLVMDNLMDIIHYCWCNNVGLCHGTQAFGLHMI